MSNQGYLLLVEDNINVQSNNKKILERRGYALRQAMTLAEARGIIAEETPRAIVLDIMLPDGSGLDFLQELRRSMAIPVLLLTALGTPKDIITGLEAGGDDYLPKPYDLDVFLAKVAALLRRSAIIPATIRAGSLTLDTASLTAYLNDKDLLLPQKEFALLQLFIQNEGKTMSAEYIYEKVWGQNMAGDENAIKVALSRLRTKLKGSEFAVIAVRSEGYCFERV